MKNATLFLLLISILFTTHFLTAQKWGKVSEETLKMTSIPEDPESDAVILFDIGDMKITKEFTLIFKRHVRIKVLTEKGKEYADIRLRFWHEDKIRDLEAQCYSSAGKKIKLDKDQIFEEQADEWYYKVFAIPGVEVGSVFEYKYELHSDYLTFLEPWYFQNREFTKLSQISVTLRPGFNYNSFFTNTAGVETPKPEVEDIIEPELRGSIKKFTWRMKNLGPIKKEPYMTTIKDYLTTLYFQLISFRNQYVSYKFINTWNDLAKKFKERVGDYLDDGSLKDEISMMINDSLSDYEKAKIIYDKITTTIETDDYPGVRIRNDLDKMFEDKKASAFEKNILLVNLLRRADLDATLLLISTRDHGRINETFPQLQQFNHVLVLLNIDNTSYFLDAKDKYCHFGMLPPSDIVYKGFLIQNKTGKIIPLPEPKDLNWLTINTKAELNEEGSLQCNSILRYEGYRAAEERMELAENEHREYLEEELKDRFNEVELDSFRIEAIEDIEAPLTISVHYRVPNYVEMSGDMIYLSYPIFNRMDSNPFKLENRTFPVEFNYPLSALEEVELNLPTGLSIVEKPNLFQMKSKGISFSSIVEEKENRIELKRRYMRTNDFYAPNEYSALREFYSKMVDADNSVIVISKQEE